MQPIKNLFGQVMRPPAKSRRTERGDLEDYFLSILNPARQKDGYPLFKHGFMQRKLERIPTGDLYALKSKMEDARRRNFNPAVVFWVELRPLKEDNHHRRDRT